MKYLFGVLFFILCFSLSAQKMELSEEVVDFGTIQKGKDVKAVLTVKNVGNAPLILTKVKPSCGCTAPSWPNDPIMPGKSGEISLVYNDTKVGIINKVVEIYSNDPNASRKVVRIKGEIN